MSLLQLPHPWADTVLLTGLALGGLITGYRKHPHSLVLLGLGVVLSAFWVPVGTSLGGAEIVPISLFVGIVAREMIERRSGSKLPVPRVVVLLAVGLGMAAVVSSFLAPEAPSGSPGGMLSPAIRPLVQAGSYGLILLFFLVPSWIPVGPRELRTVSRGFQITVGVSALYGLYQLVAFWTELPFRGIQYFGGDVAREGFGIMTVGGIRLFRMSGLSNEPKQLAAVAIVAFVMALLSHGLYRRRSTRWILLGICGMALVGAWSTGGLLAAGLVLVAGLLWVLISPQQIVHRGLQLAVAILIVGITLIVLSGQSLRAVELVREIAFGRVQLPLLADVTGGGERIENAVIDHFSAHPLSLVTGLGLGLYPYVVGPPGQWVWAEGIQPMHSLPLTLLADFGLIGLAVLGGAVMKVDFGQRFHWIGVDGHHEDVVAYRTVLLGLMAALLVSVFVNLLPLALLFLGVLHSYRGQKGRNRRGIIRRPLAVHE